MSYGRCKQNGVKVAVVMAGIMIMSGLLTGITWYFDLFNNFWWEMTSLAIAFGLAWMLHDPIEKWIKQ